MGEGTIFPSPEKQDVLEILAEIQGNLLGIPVDRGHRDLAANEVRVDRLGELRQTFEIAVIAFSFLEARLAEKAPGAGFAVFF